MNDGAHFKKELQLAIEQVIASVDENSTEAELEQAVDSINALKALYKQEGYSSGQNPKISAQNPQEKMATLWCKKCNPGEGVSWMSCPHKRAITLSLNTLSTYMFTKGQVLSCIPWTVAFNKRYRWVDYYRFALQDEKFYGQHNKTTYGPTKEWRVWANSMNEWINGMFTQGPDGEAWGDDEWDYCHDGDCEVCNVHAIHSGYESDAHNSIGEHMPLAIQALKAVGPEPLKDANLPIDIWELHDFDWLHPGQANQWEGWSKSSAYWSTNMNMPWSKAAEKEMEHTEVIQSPEGQAILKKFKYKSYQTTKQKSSPWGTSSWNPKGTITPPLTSGMVPEDAVKSAISELINNMNTKNEQDPKKKTTAYPVGSKKRARKIMNAIARFDSSWNRDIGLHTFVNTLRCSNTHLYGFVELLLKNLLEREAPHLFKQHLEHLRALSSLPLGMEEYDLDMLNDVKAYYNPDELHIGDSKQEKRQLIANKIANHIENILTLAIDDNITSSRNMGDPHYLKFNLDDQINTKGIRKRLKTLLHDSLQGGLMSNIFMKAYLTYDGDEGSTDPISQKAGGIRAIGLRPNGLSLFTCPRSMHISLESAMESSSRDLLLSIGRTWDGTRRILAKGGLYIRTCPATPRPGALPNVLAKTPEQFVEGVRMLAQCMIDPSHSDYDPEGCLVAQRFIKPICSGVVGKSATSFIIGPSHDGVTAGGGSNIIFNLNGRGQRYLSRDIRTLDLDDGMEHHEVEFVYKNPNKSTLLTWFKKTADNRHQGTGARIPPTMTQMRGLHAEKMDIRPPPSVNDVVLHIAGNVPAGVVEQLVVMDVGKGSLDECLELEQMAKKGELPEGLVVYAPGGTQNAHVAGLSSEYKFPAIYGVKPYKNHTVWTEIHGWVTDLPGAEPEPYTPEPFIDFYKIGLRDGDRFWTYNLAPLSQFFHNFISGPKNDPRLEAYLAGVFTTWIVKAALAVSMGELRHGMGSRCYMTPQRTFAHICIQQGLSGDSGISDLYRRSDYYRRLEYNELGYDVLSDIAQFYSDSYNSDWCEWSSGSYGGQKYFMSTNPTSVVTKIVKRLLDGENIRLQTILNQVNKLENAVHNTGFFFNKFLDNKDAFDIGTGGHRDFASACEHWIVTAPFYATFYTKYVNEPHRIASGHDKLVNHLYKQVSAHQRVQSNFGTGTKEFNTARLLKLSRTDTGDNAYTPLVDTWENYDTPEEHRKLFKAPIESGCTLHTVGVCGVSGCTNADCKNYFMMESLGLNKTEVKKLRNMLTNFVNDWVIYPDQSLHTSETMAAQILQNSVRDPTQTMFEETERKVEKPEITVESLADGVYMYTDDDGNKHLWYDEKLKEWWGEIEDTLESLSITDALLAWNNPASAFPKISKEANVLDKNLIAYLKNIYGAKKKQPKILVQSSLFTEPHPLKRPFQDAIKKLMCNHYAKNYNVHKLLELLSTEGSIKDLLEII